MFVRLRRGVRRHMIPSVENYPTTLGREDLPERPLLMPRLLPFMSHPLP